MPNIMPFATSYGNIRSQESEAGSQNERAFFFFKAASLSSSDVATQKGATKASSF